MWPRRWGDRFQKALGAIHALSHPVGSLYDTHHGMTNAVFMPYVLQFNRPAIEDKIERLGAYLGLKPGFTGFLDWILALRAETHVPHTLAEFKVGTEKFDLMSKMSPKDPTAGGNPVPARRGRLCSCSRQPTEVVGAQVSSAALLG
jgi:alcohol dehydrogenase